MLRKLALILAVATLSFYVTVKIVQAFSPQDSGDLYKFEFTRASS